MISSDKWYNEDTKNVSLECKKDERQKKMKIVQKIIQRNQMNLMIATSALRENM